MKERKNLYKASGVDVEKSTKLVKKIEKISSNFKRKEIIDNPGGFSALFDLKKLRYKDPILLSSTDGVGTKLKIASEFKKYNNLGFDLVAMCVNDILANGGEPLFFLDYISASIIKENFFLKLIKSINIACEKSGCSLVGGETAEMPGMYNSNDFDIAGFSVGVVERKNLLSKKKVNNGNVILGLESNGFHSNGYSLIRKILNENKINLNVKTPYKSGKKKLGDDLLLPTRIYTKIILPLIKKNLINCIAHITGGGIIENLERIIPDKMQAIIDIKNFTSPERFQWLSRIGQVSSSEMLKTFNCGIGLIIIIEERNEKNLLKELNKLNTNVIRMGSIVMKKSSSKVFIKNFKPWY